MVISVVFTMAAAPARGAGGGALWKRCDSAPPPTPRDHGENRDQQPFSAHNDSLTARALPVVLRRDAAQIPPDLVERRQRLLVERRLAEHVERLLHLLHLRRAENHAIRRACGTAAS